MNNGLVLNIQRMSTEDGPGLRTTVFLKGCTLRCAWCHNPESIAFKKEHEWFAEKCIGCRTCEQVCEPNAISFVEDRLLIDVEKCNRCMLCVEKCPTNALEAKGIEYSDKELLEELLKDKAYFGEKGGVTLSGGEALAQPEFTEALLAKLKAAGVHTAVDTCGQIPFNIFEKVTENVSLYLYDIKVIDSEKHKAFTGQGNGLVLENLKKLGELIRQNCGQTKLWIRTPLIPGASDDDANIRGIAKFIEANIADVMERWELLAFNNLCASKYERQNREWQFGEAKVQDAEKIAHIKSMIAEFKHCAGKAFVAQEPV